MFMAIYVHIQYVYEYITMRETIAKRDIEFLLNTCIHCYEAINSYNSGCFFDV